MILPNIQYTGRRKLVGIVVSAKNKPGTLGSIAGVLGGLNVNIVSLNMSSLIGWGEGGTIYIVGDLSRSNVDVEFIVDQLSNLKDISEVKIVHPQKPQVLVDPSSFPIVDPADRRLIVLSEHSMEALAVSFKEKFGEAGKAFLYHQGLIQGELLAKKYLELGVENLKDLLETHFLHMLAYGRYVGEIEEYSYGSLFQKDHILIHITRNWECEISKKHGLHEASSHFERGVIAGLIQAYTGMRVKIDEVECVALGSDSCKFDVIFQE